MKKLHVMAIVATLLTVGSVFAQTHGRLFTQANATFAPANTGAFGGPGGPSTTNNDDSCDISTAPAATLLLPYFEVDISNNNQATARTTIFTITNVSNIPQIAHIAIWTDWSFPVLDFNVFLTGYDVQSINLYDILNRGIIAPTALPPSQAGGTSNTTPVGRNNGGNTPNTFSLSANNITGNPNFGLNGGKAATDCANLVGSIANLPLFRDVQTALTTGVYPTTCTSAQRVGGTHANAIGYITIDVDSDCTTTLPNSRDYFAAEILYDNVLIGDYQDINPNPTTGNFAGGNPLVHIRAIPEGGPAASFATVTSNLPFTFYDRYTATGGTAISAGAPRNVDRRQPLPSTFAARYIQGGTDQFSTNFKIWREGINVAGCATALLNSNLAVSEIVRFDEHENFLANVASNGPIISPPPANAPGVTLPETSSTPTSAATFPAMNFVTNDVSGWMYLNLDNGGRNAVVNPFSTLRASQNWVIVSMFAQGRFSVDFDAAWLGNGCSPPAAISLATNGLGVIGPAGGFVTATNKNANVTP